MPIIYILIAANVFIFILPYIIDFSRYPMDSFRAFLELGWNSSPEIRDGEFYRLLTSTFLHGDSVHLFVNMFSLWSIGPAVVRIFQPQGFFIIYLISGLSGSLASFFASPNVPSVGASGSIFGLVGALVSYSFLSNNTSLLNNLVIVIAVNLLIGFSSGGRIDNWGHLGGLVAGIVLGVVFSPNVTRIFG